MNSPSDVPEKDGLIQALGLDGPSRYELAISMIAKTRELWIIESDENTLTLDSAKGEELLPVWPTEISASACLTEEERLDGFLPVRRALEDWLQRSTPALVRERVMVGVFPTKEKKCPVVSPEKFAHDLLQGTTSNTFLQSKDLQALRKSAIKKKRN